MSSTVDNVRIHVHIGNSILVVRSEVNHFGDSICTPVNDSPHGQTRRRAEGIIIPDIIPRVSHHAHLPIA